MTVAKMIEQALKENPDLYLVLEIAARAHEVEGKETPLYTGMANDTVVIPTSLQCPVPPERLC